MKYQSMSELQRLLKEREAALCEQGESGSPHEKPRHSRPEERCLVPKERLRASAHEVLRRLREMNRGHGFRPHGSEVSSMFGEPDVRNLSVVAQLLRETENRAAQGYDADCVMACVNQIVAEFEYQGADFPLGS